MHPTDRDRMMAHADDDEARNREARERVTRQCPPNTCKACGREAVTWDGKCTRCLNAEAVEPNEAAMTVLTKALDMTIGPVATKATETCTRCGREALTVGGHCGRCIRQLAVGEPVPTLAVCRKCLTLKPNATGLCDGCAADMVREGPRDVSARDPGDETREDDE